MNPQPVSETACRRLAAEFYLRGINGIVDDWIKTGDDDRDGVDQDIKDCAAMLWGIALAAQQHGVVRD